MKWETDADAIYQLTCSDRNSPLLILVDITPPVFVNTLFRPRKESTFVCSRAEAAALTGVSRPSMPCLQLCGNISQQLNVLRSTPICLSLPFLHFHPFASHHLTLNMKAHLDPLSTEGVGKRRRKSLTPNMHKTERMAYFKPEAATAPRPRGADLRTLFDLHQLLPISALTDLCLVVS
jgi:hypothetical protein